MYSRKAIETALYFSAGESNRWSLNGLQFREDGSIRATDGHKAVVVPPQFERSECPKPYKKTRAEVFVPYDVLKEMLRRTKEKGNRAGTQTWYGVETVKRVKVRMEGDREVWKDKSAFFSWGMAQEWMEFEHDASFPDLHRVANYNDGDPILSISLGAEATIGLLQAAQKFYDRRDSVAVQFDFYGPDKPINWRMGGVFGVLMPRRNEEKTQMYERVFRGLDKPEAAGEKPIPDAPEAAPDQGTAEAGEKTPAEEAAALAIVNRAAIDQARAARDSGPAPEPPRPPDGMFFVTVSYSDVYDVALNGEYSEDTGLYRDNEEMDPEDVAALIREADGHAEILPDGSLLWRGKEDMFGHTMNKGMTLMNLDCSPLTPAEWAWLLDEAGIATAKAA